MARTPSNMIPLGTPIPHFQLVDSVSGGMVASKDCFGANGLLVMFICNHCPFVKHMNSELANLGKDLPKIGIGVVAISANDIESYPEDAPDKMKEVAQKEGYSFPYLFDEEQNVAKIFEAACTPDFFLFNGEGKLAYRGQLDDSRPENGLPVSGRDLRAAAEALCRRDGFSRTETKYRVQY